MPSTPNSSDAGGVTRGYVYLADRLKSRSELTRNAIIAALESRLAGVWTSGEVRELRDRTVLHVVQDCLELWAAGRDVPEAEMAFLCDRGVDLSRLGCSFSDITLCCDVIGTTMIADFWSVAEDSDFMGLADFTRWQAEQLPRVKARIQASLADTLRDEMMGRKVRREYAQALSMGVATWELATAAEVPRAFTYVVMVPIVTSMAMQRSLLTAAEALDGDRWRVLLCEGDPLPIIFLAMAEEAELKNDGAAPHMNSVNDFYRALRARMGGGWAIATSYAGPREKVPDALEEAREIAAVARYSGSCGVITDEMVPLDKSIVSDHGLRDALCSVVAPLIEQSELADTLDLLYRFDLDRGRTANALGIHRRTLVHRLRRVADKTNLNPVSSRGVAVLQLGLVAARAAGQLRTPHLPPWPTDTAAD
jgi:hypothetical protein